MTAAWLGPEPAASPDAARGSGLRLVSGREPAETPSTPGDRSPTHPVCGARRVPLEVRRRRTLLAAMGLLLVALALPLGGTGGHSHATGPALAGTAGQVSYMVRPGDTLWSIAERAEPNADPRPLVARLAARDGSNQVVPGERIVVP